MEKHEKIIEVLNDLIKINNDRVQGYEKASEEVKDKDLDLIGIFNKMSDQSRKYSNELTREVVSLGGEPSTDTTVSGKVYRLWMDLKSAISGKDRTSVLGSCEYGEDVAQKAYQSALESDAVMSTETRQLIATQKSDLKSAHDQIKLYRDANEKVA